MDVVKVVDLWQVILQEPRVANQEAHMLLQPEIEQNLLRDKLENEQARQQKSIQKIEKTDSRIKLSERRRRKRDKNDFFDQKGNKKHAGNKCENIARNSVITKDHVDVIA